MNDAIAQTLIVLLLVAAYFLVGTMFIAAWGRANPDGSIGYSIKGALGGDSEFQDNLIESIIFWPFIAFFGVIRGFYLMAKWLVVGILKWGAS